MEKKCGMLEAAVNDLTNQISDLKSKPMKTEIGIKSERMLQSEMKAKDARLLKGSLAVPGRLATQSVTQIGTYSAPKSPPRAIDIEKSVQAMKHPSTRVPGTILKK